MNLLVLIRRFKIQKSGNLNFCPRMKKMLGLLIAVLLYGCSSDGNVEEEILQDVIVEVVLYEFTPDTGNNSQRLRYEIKFVNPNDISIRGSYEITTNADGLITTQFFTTAAPCAEINANSDCTITFDEEESFESGLATIQSLELISVDYEIFE